MNDVAPASGKETVLRAAEPPRALLLDLDDTILDDRQTSVCWNDTCAELGQGLSVSSAQLSAVIQGHALRYWSSNPTNHRIGRMNLNATRRSFVRAAFRELGLSPLSLADQIADSFSQLRLERMCPMPGAFAALERLRRLQIPLALITNGEAERQRAKLLRFQLERYFDCIVVEGEFGRGKPEPEVYVHALAALGASPPHTWMIGDNLEWDVAAPKRLGLAAAWVDHSSVGLPPDCNVSPDRIVQSLAELVESWWGAHSP